MDETDSKILERLKQDGRASFTGIASDLDVSEATVRNRVEKMKQNNVIKRFTVETGRSAAEAVVMVKTETDREIQKITSEFPDGITVKEVAGGFDLVLQLEADSMETLNQELDEIRKVEGVEETTTYTVLKTRET